MIRKFTMIALITIAGWSSQANAALVGACTFAAGCGPDFNIVGMGAVSYNYNAGSGTGDLIINGTVGNASFIDGQLDPWSSTLYGSGPNAGTAYGNTSLLALGAPASSVGNDNFSLTLTVDSSGSIISSSVSMNGFIGVYDGGFVPAVTTGGTTLNGNLIENGFITDLGWSGTTIDFLGGIGGTSLLAEFGPGLGGVLSLSNLDIGTVQWDQSWTAQSATLDVVVPIPAAIWLFTSGLMALVSVSRRKSL